jgi:hypothetical protein
MRPSRRNTQARLVALTTDEAGPGRGGGAGGEGDDDGGDAGDTSKKRKRPDDKHAPNFFTLAGAGPPGPREPYGAPEWSWCRVCASGLGVVCVRVLLVSCVRECACVSGEVRVGVGMWSVGCGCTWAWSRE